MSHAALYLAALQSQPPTRRRRLPPHNPRPGIDFSSNDYLGLSRDPRLARAAYQASLRYGNGATGSRLLSGTTQLHRAFERRLARDLNTDAALIFPSGYQLNIGIIAALLDRTVVGNEPFVVCDRLIHASLHSGLQLAGVRYQRYHHHDLNDLRRRLEAARPDQSRFIITESIFGMDGDCSDLRTLLAIADEFDALLIIDDAHGIGIAGPHGYGLAATLGVDNGVAERVVILGTFSKGLGAGGAFAACSTLLHEYLIARCGAFIYSTAIAPALLGAAWTAWHLLPQLEQRRNHILEHAAMLRRMLCEDGFQVGASQSHIVPIIFGSDDDVLAAQRRLAERGISASAIRPPTVPPATARLRIAVCAFHTSADIAALVAILREKP